MEGPEAQLGLEWSDGPTGLESLFSSSEALEGLEGSEGPGNSELPTKNFREIQNSTSLIP